MGVWGYVKVFLPALGYLIIGLILWVAFRGEPMQVRLTALGGLTIGYVVLLGLYTLIEEVKLPSTIFKKREVGRVGKMYKVVVAWLRGNSGMGEVVSERLRVMAVRAAALKYGVKQEEIWAMSGEDLMSLFRDELLVELVAGRRRRLSREEFERVLENVEVMLR